MKRFFDPEAGIWRLLGCLADLLLLSMLWVLCAAPVLTAGAATAALYDAVVHGFHRKESDTLPRFFACFKRELKNALLPTLLCAALLYALLRLYALAVSALSGAAGLMLGAALFVLLLIPVGALCWVFPLLSRFTLTLPTLLTNSLRLSLGHLPRTLLIAAATCGAVYGTLRLALLPVFLSPALLALGWSWLMEPVLRRYED